MQMYLPFRVHKWIAHAISMLQDKVPDGDCFLILTSDQWEAKIKTKRKKKEEHYLFE